MVEHRIGVRDGRQLQVREEGDPKGVPVFSLHGTPGSRLLYGPFSSDAQAKGIRLIGYDRPGYGGSTPAYGRRVVDSAADVAAIADVLGIERFGVWGASGGGPPAIACAAAFPRRVVAAASLGGPAPYFADGLDWTAGMGEWNVADLQLMLHDQAWWEQKCRSDRAEMLESTRNLQRDAFSSLDAPADRASDTAEYAEFRLRQGREGLRVSEEGMRDDSLAMAQPWGIDLSDIRVPVQILHGGQDRYVPFAHGQWLATHIPQAVAHLDPAEGHHSLILHRTRDVQTWLASKF